jgi:glycosidase
MFHDASEDQAMKIRFGMVVLLLCLLGGSLTFSVDSGRPLPARVAFAGPSASSFTKAADWQDEILYLVMLDRFHDGSAANNLTGTDKSQAKWFHGGDLVGLTSKLDYIKSTGATAIWITPVYQQVGQYGDSWGYHGYWFEDAKMIDPRFGTEAELHGLISGAHAKGLKVILDLVVNHTGYNATLTSSQPSWFHTPSDCMAAANTDEVCPLDKLPDFKQENPTVAAFLKDAVKHWINTYAIDGIRMDTVKHVPHAFWSNLISEVDGGVGMKNGAGRPDLFWVGEALISHDRALVGAYQSDGFESMFDFPLRQDLVNSFGKGGSVDLLAQGLTYDTYYPTPNLITTLLDNHDVVRFVNEPGFGVPEDEIRSRQMLALDFIFTIRGIPQVYYGSEIGMYGGGDPDNRRDMPSWAWNGSGRAGVTTAPGFIPHPQRTFEHVARLASIRKSNPALYKGSYREMWRQNATGPNVLSYFRGDGASRIIVGLNNGTLTSGVMAIGLGGLSSADQNALPDGQVLDDLLGGKPTTISRRQWRADIPALTGKIMRPRAASSANSRVTFTASSATTVPGQDVYVVGNIPELGEWDPRRAVKMAPTAYPTWSVPVSYLPRGQAIEFKFIKVDGSGNVTWEGGSDRSFTVPNSASSSAGGAWQ